MQTHLLVNLSTLHPLSIHQLVNPFNFFTRQPINVSSLSTHQLVYPFNLSTRQLN